MGHVAPTLTTTTQLLEDLRNPRADNAWEMFDARYRPILIGVARRTGLNEDEAHEIAQDTLCVFANLMQEGRYDRERGRLRTWLTGIARNRILQFHRTKRAARGQVDQSADAFDIADSELESVWETEQRRLLLRQAMQQLRSGTKTAPRTIRAFERFVIDGQPAEVVARELDMTPRDVYVAKIRVASRLRQIYDDLSRSYADD